MRLSDLARNSLSGAGSPTSSLQSYYQPAKPFLSPTKWHFPGAAGPWEAFQRRLFFFVCVIWTVNFVSELKKKRRKRDPPCRFCSSSLSERHDGGSRLGLQDWHSSPKVLTFPKPFATCKWNTCNWQHCKTYGQGAGGQQEGFLCISFSNGIELRNEVQSCEHFTFQGTGIAQRQHMKAPRHCSDQAVDSSLISQGISPLRIPESTVCRQMTAALTTQSTEDAICRPQWKDFLNQE